MNASDLAGNEEEEEWWTPEIKLGTQKKNSESRDLAGNAEEEEEWWTPEI